MANALNTQGLMAALAAEFGAAIEAVLGSALTVTLEPAPAGRGWSIPITASGALSGTLTASLDTAGVRAVATQMMNLEGEPEDEVVIDMLRELWAQTASSTALRDGFEGLTLSSGTPAPEECAAVATAWVLRDGATALAQVGMTGQVTPGVGVSRLSSPAPGHQPEVIAGVDSPGNLAALLDIDLPLVVRFARTELSLRALTMLGPGSLVDMGRSPDAPVQLLVGSQVIAEGEVVVVAGNYGVRITSLVSPAERLRAMDL